jgi:hypothetical protein
MISIGDGGFWSWSGRDSYDWLNLIIGGVGLFLTVLAIIQATGAKTAARRAERSVKRRSAEADFEGLAQMARDLHQFVQKREMPEAKLRTADLIPALAVAISQHAEFLAKHKYELKTRQLDLKLLTNRLIRSDVLSASETIKAMELTGGIMVLLKTVSGDLRARENAEGQNE